MTTLTERAVAAVRSLPVERMELSRKGHVLLELSGEGEPCWVQLGDDGPLRLRPDSDADLPLAARLSDLRGEQGATVLAWRPGRRMVLRVRGGVLKAFRSGRLRQSLERNVEGARAARAAGLETAEVLSVDPQTASFRLRDLGGQRVPVAVDSAPRYRRLGAALARFQTLEPDGPALARHDVRAELEVLDGMAEKTLRLCGALPTGWEPARDQVERALVSAGTGPLVRVHRDLHDGQLLACGAGLALLDFDLLCLAGEALDASNLLAHLELRALQGLATSAAAQACERAFREGYGRSEDAELHRRLSAWGAATFARLALVYRLRPPYAHLAPRLVQRADERAGEVHA